MALTKVKTNLTLESIVSKSATYTATIYDSLILCDTSSAFTITMPTEAAASGIVYTFKKTSSDLNALTINDDAASEITTVNTEGEIVKIISDGTSWYILDRYIPSIRTAYTPTVVGFGTVSSVSFYSARVKDCIEIQGIFTAGTPTATTASITMGFNGTNGSITPVNVTAVSIVGGGSAGATASTTYFNGLTVLSTAGNTVNLGIQTSTTSSMTAANGNVITGAGAVISVCFKVPISGWKG